MARFSEEDKTTISDMREAGVRRAHRQTTFSGENCGRAGRVSARRRCHPWGAMVPARTALSIA
jgi:hypothetical protein